MSRLSELIAELCPDGVEYKALGSIAILEDYVANGSFASLKANVKYLTEPDYAILVRIADYSSCFDKSKFKYVDKHAYEYLSKSKLDAGDVILSSVGSVGIVFECPDLGQPMTLGPNAIVLKSECNRYLYHWFNSYCGQNALRGLSGQGTLPKINKTALRKLCVPVPPIEVQREIVRILDSFQELDDALTAEIEARTEQFHYLQDELYMGANTEKLPLGSCVRFINGRAYKRAELLSEGKYRVLRVGNFFSNDSWYYSDLELESEKYCFEGDLLYAWSASFGPRVWHGEKTIFHYHIWKLVFDESAVDKGYLLYFLDFDSRRIKESSSVTQSTMMHVSMAQMKKRLIPLPSPDEQRHIARRLRDADELLNSLRSEREARRKQFSYYRDKLLEFPEKVTA